MRILRTPLLLAVALGAALPAVAWAQGPQPTVIPVPAIPSPDGDPSEPDDDAIPSIEPDTATPPAEVSAAQKKKDDALKGTVHDPDYKKAIDANFPLSPEQIEDYGRVEDSIDRAVGSRRPPNVATATLHVTSHPGVAPQRVMLSDDYITSLSVLDNTGSPWPISRAVTGNSKMFAIEVPPDPGNVVILAPLRKYAASNLMLILKGSSVPIVVSIENNREAAYYNVNLVLDEAGPKATRDVVRPPVDPIDDAFMRSILDGAGGVTAGVRQVKIAGGAETTAYMAGSKFYLRTPYTLIFPQNNTASMRSGGMRVYEIPVTPLITVADENGRPIDLQPSDETLIEGALAAHITQRNPVSSMKVTP